MSATNRGAERVENDFYPTPAIAVDSILNELKPLADRVFLEPCAGDGAILNRVPMGRKYWCELSQGTDYLESIWGSSIDLIITNPPFSLAIEFLTKSLTEADTVIYLLRLNFLGSQKRKAFWQANPPTHLFPLSKRPSFTGKGTDSADYGWFAWDKGGLLKRKPGIYVL